MRQVMQHDKIYAILGICLRVEHFCQILWELRHLVLTEHVPVTSILAVTN